VGRVGNTNALRVGVPVTAPDLGRPFTQDHGTPQIGDQRPAVRREEDVSGREIPVNEAPRVQLGEGTGNRDDRRARFPGVERASGCHEVAETATRGEVHDKGSPAVRQIDDPAQPYDVRMVDPA
jgi:hypothetical protein